MTNRLGLTAGDRALVGDLASDGVSLHLLRELPAALIRSALAAVGARREHDAGAYARSLGMSRPEALVTAAEILEVSTAGLQHVLGAHPELTAGFTPAPLPAGVDSSADNLRRQAVEHGTALAGHIRSALGAAGLEGPALDQWIRWTARLGFDVQNLSEILPGPLAQQSTYISRLIGAALHDERPDTVRNLLQEVLPVRGPAGLVDGDLKEQIRATALAGPEADDLARDLRVPPRILDQLGTVPTVNPHDLRALVRQTGLSGRETGVLIDLAARTGHLPEARDLLRLSARTGWSPGRLLDLARALDVDPALLWPLRDVLERVDSLPEGDVYRPTPAQVAGSVREYLDLTPGGMSADGWLWLAGQGRGPHGFTLSGLRHLRKGTQAMQQPLADYLTAQTKTAARVIADVTATVGAAQQRLVGTGSPADREVLNRAFAVAASARGLTSRDEATRVQQVRLMGAAALRTAEKAGVRREDTEQLLDRLGGLNDAGRGPQSGRVVSAAVEAAHLTAHSVRTALRSAGPNERLHASVLAHQFERLASALTRHLNAEYRLLDHAAADWTGLVGRYLTPDTDGSVFRAPPGNQADQLLASWWSDRLGIAAAHVREILAQVPTLDLAKVRSAAQAFDVPVQTVLGHVSRDALWLAGVEQYIEGARQGNAKQRALRIVYDTSTITQIQPQWTLRLVGSLWESTDARDVALLGDPAALAGHLRTALLGFGGALPRELPIRAAFLTDLRLDLTDLPGRGDHTGRAELAEQTELWRATTLGLTTAEYRAVRSLDWFSGDRWSDLLDELREDAAERNPGEHWDDDTMFRLAEQFDVSMLWLNGFAHRIGRMPADLPVLAEQWGIDDAGRLFALAVELDVDPRDLVTAWPERIGALVEGRDPEPVLAAREQWREQAIEALKDALNDEEIDRDAAVAQAVENLRDLDWTAPPPRTLLPGALLAIATATRRIPEDLLVRSASANLVPADLIMATRLASTDGPVDPAAIVAYVLAAGPAAAPVLDDPARLADAYRTWADTLQRDLGIAPAEISRLHDQARTINLTLTDVAAGDQPRQLVENLRAAAFPNAYMRTMIEIFTSSFTSTNVFDHARALERFTRFTEQVAAAGRAYPPLMPSLELDLTATLEFRIHDGADTLRESVPRAVAIPADGRSGSLTLTADQPDWRALSAVQSAMASAAVEVDRIQVRTSSGTYQVEGFADLAPAEAMTLIATLAMDGGDLTAAVRTLGWDTRVTNAGSGPAITTLTRRPLDVMPSPEAFEAFRAHEVAALAMLTVASGHRIANLIADPDAETPAAAVPEEAETPAVRQPGNPMPDGWVNHGNLQPVTVDTLARAVRGSAARMGLPMAAGVTSGPALIAHAADQLDSGRSTLPGVLESAAEMLTGKMSPESRALLGSTVGDLQHIGLPPVGMDVITWALIRGDLPTMQYVETYYDENPGAPAERLARRFVAAARAGTPLTSEQALAEFLRDPQIRAGLPASVVGPVLAHTLGVNLVQVAANGTTTTVPGPENAR
ncbi:MAG TPA: hypothetical protein VN408_25325, partial [Actinoplanes sp.]|nr:hypothetical protein [Actinoplanes sp.]